MNKEKVQKEYPDFVKEVDHLDAEALKARIVGIQQALEESDAHMEANESLAAAKASVTELAGPYRDFRKASKLKTKYLIDLLKAQE